MECKNEHFRHIFLFYFRKGKNAAQAAKKLHDADGEEALKDRQCRNWFDKYRSGDFSLKNEQRSSRPNEVDDDQIKAIIESNRHVTVREFEKMLKIPKSTIDRHMEQNSSSVPAENLFVSDFIESLRNYCPSELLLIPLRERL